MARTLADPAVLISSSDAGAHMQMLCASGDTTLLLTRHVRERGDFTLEQAVHELTGRQAEVFGFHGRGVGRPRAAIADLVVFALDELHYDDDEFVDDLPGGGCAAAAPRGRLPGDDRRRRARAARRQAHRRTPRPRAAGGLAVSAAPVIIEAAINGAHHEGDQPQRPEVGRGGRRRRPRRPRRGRRDHPRPLRPDRWARRRGRRALPRVVPARCWEERPDALLYPTVNIDGGLSFGHLAPMAAEGLRVGLLDPGSVNLGRRDDDGLPAGGFVYANSFDRIKEVFALHDELGLGPSLAIYEPGFLYTTLEYWKAGRLPAGTMVKFYLSTERGLSGAPFGLPPTAPASRPTSTCSATHRSRGPCRWSAATSAGARSPSSHSSAAATSTSGSSSTAATASRPTPSSSGRPSPSASGPDGRWPPAPTPPTSSASPDGTQRPRRAVRSRIPSVARNADSGTIGKRSLMSPFTNDQS